MNILANILTLLNFKCTIFECGDQLRSLYHQLVEHECVRSLDINLHLLTFILTVLWLLLLLLQCVTSLLYCSV